MEDEKSFYDSVVHGLRSRGWPREDAEDEAANKVYKLRSADKAVFGSKDGKRTALYGK